MPRTDVIRRVRHPWHELYELVLDVESYPQFVPFCRAMKLIEKNPRQSGEELIARMEVDFASFRENYINQIEGFQTERKIIINAIDGPFNYLKGAWYFTSVSEKTTEVNFSVEYEFCNPLLSAVAGRAFKSIFGGFVSAFENRTNLVFGQS